MFKEKFIESCLSDLSFNEIKIDQLGFKCSDTSLLMSFPRSGNGWVRSVISILYALKLDSFIAKDELKEIFFSSLEDEINVNTAALCFGNKGRLPVDSYVPDIYLYEKVRANLASCQSGDLMDVKPKNIFKTHHLSNSESSFRSLGVILRKTDECVLSAALLLVPGLLEKSESDVSEIARYFVSAYKRYIEGYLKLISRRHIYLIKLDDPARGLRNWLAYVYPNIQGCEVSLVEEIQEVINVFPLRSGYDKRIHERVELNRFDEYAELLALYEQLCRRTDSDV